MKHLVIVSALVLTSLSALAGPRPTAQATSCLKEVAEFVERMCGQIPSSPNKSLVEANGKVRADNVRECRMKMAQMAAMEACSSPPVEMSSTANAAK